VEVAEAMALGIGSRLSQLEVAYALALALAFGIGSRLFLLEVTVALALAFGIGSRFFLFQYLQCIGSRSFLFQSKQRDRRQESFTILATFFAPKNPLSSPPLAATVVWFFFIPKGKGS
jgi:hypothetical protein